MILEIRLLCGMMLRTIVCSYYEILLVLSRELYDAASRNFFCLNLTNMGHLYLVSAKVKSKSHRILR